MENPVLWGIYIYFLVYVVFKSKLTFQAIRFQDRGLYLIKQWILVVSVKQKSPSGLFCARLLGEEKSPAWSWQRYQVNCKELRFREIVKKLLSLLTHRQYLNCQLLWTTGILYLCLVETLLTSPSLHLQPWRWSSSVVSRDLCSAVCIERTWFLRGRGYVFHLLCAYTAWSHIHSC